MKCFFVLPAIALLFGCASEEEKTLGRVPGLKTPDALEVTQTVPASGRGDVNAPALNPGMPPTGDTSSTEVVPQPPGSNVLQGGNKLAVEGIAFTIPEGWTQQQPASNMRKAQYALPGEGGPAEMAVFWFGPQQGGSLEENVKRWAGQFTSDDSSTQSLPAEVATMENDGLRIAAVKTSGTYDPGSMGMPSGGPQKGYALFGLIIEGGPRGSVFVKITGPKATIDSQANNLEDFTRSVKKSQFK